jgi:hypothetical protein
LTCMLIQWTLMYWFLSTLSWWCRKPDQVLDR